MTRSICLAIRLREQLSCESEHELLLTVDSNRLDRDRLQVNLASMNETGAQSGVPVVQQVGIGQVRMCRIHQVTELESADDTIGGLAGREALTVRVTMRRAATRAVGIATRAGAGVGPHDVAVVELDIVVDEDTATEATALRKVVDERDRISRLVAHQTVEAEDRLPRAVVQDVRHTGRGVGEM